MDTPVTTLQQRRRAASYRPLVRIRAWVLVASVLTACNRLGFPPAIPPTPDPRDQPSEGEKPRGGIPPIRLPPRDENPPPSIIPPPRQAPSATERVDLVFLGTTDVHNRLYPYDYYTRSEIPYGLARLKPVIDSVREANPGQTYLFDSGDLLQGNPLGYVYAKDTGGAAQPGNQGDESAGLRCGGDRQSRIQLRPAASGSAPYSRRASRFCPATPSSTARASTRSRPTF